MNKKDLIENIVLNNPTLTKKSVDEIVNTIFDDMAESKRLKMLNSDLQNH